MASAWPARVDMVPPRDGQVTLRLAGARTLGNELPDSKVSKASLTATSDLRLITFDSAAISAWDSGLVTYLMGVLSACNARGIEVDQSGLQEGVRGLLRLA